MSQAPPVVAALIGIFERNLPSYKSQGYNEANLRQAFVNPFFEALGWDVANKAGHAESYKDVIHEDAIKIGGNTKAPDYCFRIGGTRKFFLEAKKPAVNLKDEISPAYQLRRYAWSAKLPLSILTDFEEFAVYDCRMRPSPSDKPGIGRIHYWTYQDYLSKWDDIAAIFSKDAVLKGSFDRYAVSDRKHGTATVDEEFLKEIESWRDSLAKNLAVRNPRLSVHELNFSVQRTIDRLIFLRICEDRGIEASEQLKLTLNGKNTYGQLQAIYKKADDRYNSGLFHFHLEKERTESPDDLTPRLKIDDKVLKEIIGRLYYPQSPYEFSVFPIEILGEVYEQFLGKVIRLTASHQARVEEKPEVKKAGGVYYTPAYIVKYIVEQTVGVLCEGKTPTQISKLHILDPACGSGSFLIGAYTYLLDWHLKWYVEHGAEKHRKELFKTVDGQWRLKTSEKRRILLNSIFGVDIDSQAVEVTKLSLLLKVLEGENKESLQELLFGRVRALPDLGRNIKCGNSLIGPDYFSGQLIPDEEEVRRVNPFDWKAEFPDIVKAGGFDAIIGNPPYVDIKGLPDVDVKYVFQKYSASNNRINLFAAFLEKSHSLCNSARFRMSMIVPTALLTQDSYKALRKKFLQTSHVASLARLPNESFGKAAGDVKVDTVIVVLEQSREPEEPVEIIAYSGYERISAIESISAHIYGKGRQSTWAKTDDCLWALSVNDIEDSVIDKCEQSSVPLEQCAEFCLGLTPYDKYKGHTEKQIKDRVFHAESKKDQTYRKMLAGNDVCRYFVKWNGKEWISYGPWLGASRDQRFFIERHILVKQIIDWSSKRIWAALTDEELYNTQNAFNLLPKSGWHLNYLLAILNSKLMTYYHRTKFLDQFKMRFQKILIKDCKRFPIRPINMRDDKEKAKHDQIMSLVERMLHLSRRLSEANTPTDRDRWQRQIAATDQEIDKMVYELYGLTEEDIKIVEAASVASSSKPQENDARDLQAQQNE
jgi:type I restriction-modification system DNA methylase subunit